MWRKRPTGLSPLSHFLDRSIIWIKKYIIVLIEKMSIWLLTYQISTNQSTLFRRKHRYLAAMIFTPKVVITWSWNVLRNSIGKTLGTDPIKNVWKILLRGLLMVTCNMHKNMSKPNFSQKTHMPCPWRPYSRFTVKFQSWMCHSRPPNSTNCEARTNPINKQNYRT